MVKASKGKNETIRPRWIDPQNGSTAKITFVRPRPVSGNPHKSTELTQLEEILDRLFRKIGLAGDFQLIDDGGKYGSPNQKGLNLGGVSRNSVYVRWQPAENDTQFAYGIPLASEEMAIETLAKLTTVLEEEEPKKAKPASRQDAFAEAQQTVLHLVQTGGSVAAAMTEAMMRPHVAMAQLFTAVPAPAEESVESVPHATVTMHELTLGNGEPVLLHYRFDTTHLPMQALSEALEAELRHFGCGENIFTIKRSMEVQQPLYQRDGIHWCALQGTMKGLGFYFRAPADQVWYKFALIPDSPEEFDIAQFAESVSPVTKSPASETKAGRVIDMKKSAPSFYEDKASAIVIMDAMVERMQLGRLTQLSSATMTQLFRDLIDPELAPAAIGRVWTAWSDEGWVRRLDTVPAEFTLGPKAHKHVRESNVDFARRFAIPSRPVKETVTPTVIITPPPEKRGEFTLPILAPKIRPVVTPAAFAGSLPDIAALRASMQVQMAKLADAEGVQKRLVSCDEEIAAKKMAVKSLLDEIEVLRVSRDNLFAQLPPAEEILRMVRLLTPPT